MTHDRVDSLEDALERLGELGEDAKVLAGGQSLVPMMNFRLAQPTALVDITRVEELRGIERAADPRGDHAWRGRGTAELEER